ncbi:hypothetical protein E2C01_036367 [Portunus trituberculatus]|uniref:Uncharacterized protein n=1 Tax=Portunus trituberculatus TaxID=210409 RepID=A0A5B7FC98_PORTR|nr:hypothetical protein [Portunus trituberculatus]
MFLITPNQRKTLRNLCNFNVSLFRAVRVQAVVFQSMAPELPNVFANVTGTRLDTQPARRHKSDGCFEFLQHCQSCVVKLSLTHHPPPLVCPTPVSAAWGVVSDTCPSKLPHTSYVLISRVFWLALFSHVFPLASCVSGQCPHQGGHNTHTSPSASLPFWTDRTLEYNQKCRILEVKHSEQGGFTRVNMRLKLQVARSID